MNNLKQKEQEILADNYRAFIHHFERPVIINEDYGKGYYVFRNKEEYENGGSYVQFCYDIDYLNGWLYGAVQAVCGQIKERTDKGV